MKHIHAKRTWMRQREEEDEEEKVYFTRTLALRIIHALDVLEVEPFGRWIQFSECV